MRTSKIFIAGVLALSTWGPSASAIDYFVSPTGGNVAPFASWANAATNIQDAIDAASAGDVVWVTNGVYNAGGKVMAGDLTNRVALDKPLTVRSVNGPSQTVIQGAWDGAGVNGPLAVRCAWLTNGATLAGFTIRGGATRIAGDTYAQQSGGGVWCSSTAANVANCLILSNTAPIAGAGAYKGTFDNCLFRGNQVLSGNAGGAIYSVLRSCTITANSPIGVVVGTLTNCIVCFSSGANWSGTTTGSFCCTTPALPGVGNITADPQLLSDGAHLASTSPCRGAGTNLVSGVDIDGQPWTSPPSIGCDEWWPAPVIAVQPSFQLTTPPLRLALSVVPAGQPPFTCWWSRDGAPIEDDGHYNSSHTTNLVCNGFQPGDAGGYQVVVSNSFGMATSAVVRVVAHFVNAVGGNSLPPYLDWATAASNIQDAIDVASPGEIILVTNGVYATGGRVMAGDLTNRVVLDRAVLVSSVNGPLMTVIQGAGATNGPSAVRCAWLTNGANLSGFTLRAGATRTSGTGLSEGGGVWCATTNAVVANCLILSNAASAGAGAYRGTLKNCFLSGNMAPPSGAATVSSMLNNCTVTFNTGYGTGQGVGTNCIIYFNQPNNNIGATFAFCCTTPLVSGLGNIAASPQLLGDGLHLSMASPCRGAGTNMAGGVDIDGDPWANPPSIGCDEWQPAPRIAVQPRISLTPDPGGFMVTIGVAGQEPFVCWWTRNDAPINEGGAYSGARTTNLVVNGIGLLDGGAYQVVVSNSFGMVTSAVAQVVAHCVDAAGTNPVPPFLDWATAATNIQEAINAALPGEIVLVTNGIYAYGGKVMAGDLTNRVVLDKPVLVQGVNGALTTSIQGAWDAATTNGPLAVRCAWLTNGAVLSGFTLQGGATRNNGDTVLLQSGGGVWGSSSNAIVVNCVIRGNSAMTSGGGAYRIGLLRCTLTGNQVLGSQLSIYGGGAEACSLTNCTVSGNFSAVNAGGADMSYLKNCYVTKNVALQNGGGVNGGTLVNCTVAGNTAGGSTMPAQAGGVYGAKLTNCIVYGNRCLDGYYASTSNYSASAGTFAYCCTAPLPAGTGNISGDPKLLSDGAHIAPSSPCIGAGLTTVVTGTDIDGQSWANPPSIGCDEWLPAPILVGPPSSRLTGIPPALNLWGLAAGQPPFSYSWLKDGAILNDGPSYALTQTSNLTVNFFGPTNSGGYQLVASNAFGMATSAVAQVTVHCANVAATAPAAPYTDWPSAATNLQDAVDVAGPSEFVLVTNGVYATGGRVMAGDLTNRIAVNKPLIVASVNGPQATFIQGAYDPATANGPLAVRCAWLGQGATLQGLTLLGGATRNSGDLLALQSGGGAWCASTNELLLSCILSNNMAAYSGGGAYQGQLLRSVLWGNAAAYGGGAYHAFLANSLIRSNTASANGGGLHSTRFVNCTVTANYAPLNLGGGEWGSFGWNSIVYFNMAPGALNQFNVNDWDLSSKMNLVSCWTSSSPPPGYNSTPSPQFTVDGIHLSATSPCRGAGNPTYAFGTDLDGEPWLNPPSIGCDEFYDSDFKGPLSPGPISAFSIYGFGPPLSGVRAYVQTKLTGNADRVAWSFGDGVMLTNAFTFVPPHTWTNPGDYIVTFTAFNADNPAGVSTNSIIHVSLPDPPLVSSPAHTGTNFAFTFKAQGGVSYIVEQTTNLVSPVTWQPVTSIFTINDSTATVSDANATNVAGFYRVRIQ